MSLWKLRLAKDIDKVIDKYSEKAVGVKLRLNDPSHCLSNPHLKTINTQKLKRSIKYLLRKYDCL